MDDGFLGNILGAGAQLFFPMPWRGIFRVGFTSGDWWRTVTTPHMETLVI
jgi:hypothetical protein